MNLANTFPHTVVPNDTTPTIPSHIASVNSKFHFHVYTPNYIEKKNQLKKNIPSKNPKKQCYRVDFSTNEHNIFNLRPFLRHFLHLSNWFDWMFRFFPKFSLRLLVSFWRLKMIFRRFTEQAFFWHCPTILQFDLLFIHKILNNFLIEITKQMEENRKSAADVDHLLLLFW